MKKEVKKNGLVKIAGLMVLLTVILTWIIPQGYFQESTFTESEIARVGIFDFFTYGLLGMYYFTVIVTFLFVLGGFYQLLNKVKAYQKLTDTIAKKFKRKEILFVVLVAFIIAGLTAVTTQYFVIISIIPFILTILRKMNIDKISSFSTTFGAILVGTLGSIYNERISGINVSTLGSTYTSLLWAKIVLFAVAFIAFMVFTVLRIVKNRKEKANEEIEELFSDEEVTKKGSVWPLALILSLFFVVLVLAYMPWNAFGVECFDTALTNVQSFKVLDEPIFSYILGNVTAFGTWDIFGAQVLMLIAALLIKLVYKVKMDDVFDSFGEGFKKVGKLVVVLLLAYLVLEFAVMFPVIPTIVNWIQSFGSKFNILLGTISGLFTSLFTVEYQYTVNLVGTYFISAFADYVDQISIMLQSTFGLAGFFSPASAILLIGLSYLGISYKEWMKYIWKYLLVMLATIIVLLLIVC